MITTPIDYQSLLYRIQDQNRQQQIIQLPVDEKIYNVDLDSRTIEAPEFLSVQNEHNAETIYFAMNRYYDNTDLARDDLTIIIQYENANPTTKKKGYIYVPPFIDIETKKDEEKIIFPWVIEGPATAYAGVVSFSVRIFHLDSVGTYLFNLNTQTAKSKVLTGMNVYKTSENFEYIGDPFDQIYARINEVAAQSDLYWIKL